MSSHDVPVALLSKLAEGPQDESELARYLWQEYRTAAATLPAISDILDLFELKGLVERRKVRGGRQFKLTSFGRKAVERRLVTA